MKGERASLRRGLVRAAWARGRARLGSLARLGKATDVLQYYDGNALRLNLSRQGRLATLAGDSFVIELRCVSIV